MICRIVFIIVKYDDKNNDFYIILIEKKIKIQ